MRLGRRATFAFTLIELLVVISIIALLAALLLPAFGRVKLNSKIRTAKTDMKNMEAAILQYYADYSRYPGFYPSGGDVTYGNISTNGNTVTNCIPSNSDVMAMIMDANYGINTNHARNPRKNVYFTPSKTDNNTTNSPGPGLNVFDRQYRDPWSHPYIISLDLSGDGYCTDVIYSQKSVSQNPTASPRSKGFNNLTDFDGTDVYRLNSPVMIWSFGPDGLADANTKANQGVNKDNILSWQ